MKTYRRYFGRQNLRNVLTLCRRIPIQTGDASKWARTTVAATTFLVAVAASDPGVAQTTGSSSLPSTPPAAPATPIGAESAAAPPTPDAYEGARWKGVIINLPPPSDTLDGDLGGLRKTLSDDYGVGYLGYSVNTFYDNTLDAARSLKGQQVYLGQRPTSISANSLAVLIDLQRYGIPDGQIVVSGYYETLSWNPAGPNKLGLNALTYYQTLLDKRVELKVGLIGQTYEFAGTYVGGSLSGGIFGNSGNLFLEAGSSGQTVPTYGADVKFNITGRLYDKIGVGRSLNPDGAVAEVNSNPTGLNLKTPNSGVWVINELGYSRPAASGENRIWVRGGGIYSGGDYVERGNPTQRGTNNFGFYVLGDTQILQTSRKPGEAFRGLYAGASAEYVPPALNTFSQYYELRLYGLGLLPGRPKDQISLVANDFAFSRDAVELAEQLGNLTRHGSKSITASYSAHVFRGTYLSAGVSYTNNPAPVVYEPNIGRDLNFILGFSFFL